MLISQPGLDLLQEALNHLGNGFAHLPRAEASLQAERLRPILLEVAARMRDNDPYYHPLYVGQMLRPPHPLARLAYDLAQFINPNNHALEGGRASAAMEKEAVAEIATMLGWQEHQGHLTGGGTLANLEALWISSCLAPGKRVLASSQAHFTHQRLCNVLKTPFSSVAVDNCARMSLSALEVQLAQGDVGTVVVTMGTTAVGAVDPLHQILPLARQYGVRVHVDAAYGGYFCLSDQLSGSTGEAFAAISQVDSVAIDPHKHGWQPYGCGCIVFRDKAVARFYQHDSPYTYFNSKEVHLGEISLECSRPGAAAVALWATQRLMPLVAGGEMAQSLNKSLQAARQLADWIEQRPRHWKLLFQPELDMVAWAPMGATASQVSQLSENILQLAAQQDLYLALIRLPQGLVWPELEWDQPRVTCFRCCLMKPEHLAWIPQICERLDKVSSLLEVV